MSCTFQDDRSTPHGVIDLSSCAPQRLFSDADSIRTADDEVGREFAIRIATREEVYYLVASNHVEKDRWMTALRKSVDYATRPLTEDDELEGSDMAFH